jgi:hypothetical protein
VNRAFRRQMDELDAGVVLTKLPVGANHVGIGL